ncbi:MAG TPA: GNAT family protein [Galbitalea sp.]|jgi:RimJ/RimL family protein N-acetyltransferase|nr:GNAT family protein [Galbitalea sp.]
MTAKRPDLAVIEGRYIRLLPMSPSDLPALYAAIGRSEVFAQGYGGGPDAYRATLDEFVGWAYTEFPWGTRNNYLVCVNGGPLDGVVVGSTTLGDFELEREHAHIGWTAYDPRVWGTQVNAEAKLLLLGLGFDAGFGRIKIQTDVLNERSRAAVIKLGAKLEAIVRRDELRADGTWRDTALYSILINEWPVVRDGLESRLAKWGDRPVEYRER